MTLTTVLFDLDGTLFDTAPDLMNAVNAVLANHGKNTVALDKFRYHIHGGSKSMLAHAFGIKQTHPDFQTLKQELIDHYAKNYDKETTLFPGVTKLLNCLDQQHIPWGIVTNKPEHLTLPLLKAFDLDERSQCIVAGDTLTHSKPSPVPLQYACELLQCQPEHTVYVGDTEGDMIAARAARMPHIAVTYGYHQQHERPQDWQANFVAKHADDVLDWIQQRI